jgi:hypothetical protein
VTPGHYFTILCRWGVPDGLLYSLYLWNALLTFQQEQRRGQKERLSPAFREGNSVYEQVGSDGCGHRH